MQKMGSTWWMRGVIEQIIYFLPNILSFTMSFFLVLSPFIGGCLSLGKSLLCLQQPDFRNRKEGKAFSLSERVRERKCGQGMKINPYVCVCGHKFDPHSRQYCTDGELLRVQLPRSVKLPIIPVPELRSSRKMNHFHVSAHHTFSQLICKSPMSSFPFLCSGHEPRQRESFPFKLSDLRLIRRVHTHTQVFFGLSMFQ